MAKANETCPSCDCGICNTYPTPYEVKCADVNEKCKWGNFDFTQITFEQYVKGLK